MRMTMRRSNLLQKLFHREPEPEIEVDSDPKVGVARALNHAALQGQAARSAEATAINTAVSALEAAVVALDEMADICREAISLCERSEDNEDEALEMMMGARYAALVSRYDRISDAATVGEINLITGLGHQLNVPLAGPGGIDYAVAPQTLASWGRLGLPERLPSPLDGYNTRRRPRPVLADHLTKLTEAADKLCADAQMLAWRLKTIS